MFLSWLFPLVSLDGQNIVLMSWLYTSGVSRSRDQAHVCWLASVGHVSVVTLCTLAPPPSNWSSSSLTLPWLLIWDVKPAPSYPSSYNISYFIFGTFFCMSSFVGSHLGCDLFWDTFLCQILEKIFPLFLWKEILNIWKLSRSLFQQCCWTSAV